MSALITPELLRRLEQFQLLAARRAKSAAKGERRSKARGQSVEFAEAVKRNGGIAEMVSYEGEGHGFAREANRRDVIEKMEKFLEKYVICLQK